MYTLEPFLAAHPFFKDFSPRHVELLVACASNVRFNAGELIFREEQEANNFYLLRHGKVALEVSYPGRGPMLMQVKEAGDVLGWSWVVPPYYWVHDARALELTRAISLDGICLRARCEEDHDLGYELLKRFAHIMQQDLTVARLQLAAGAGKGHTISAVYGASATSP
jgi:CRP/FNR family cyclic AMP-dependent transcriptional regulator